MRDISDVLTVSFDSGLEDEPALCVSRRCGEKIVVLKMELGEQADILYHLLTEQMAKAEPWPMLIKTISDTKVRCPFCDTVWENISVPDAIWNSSSFMCPFCGKYLVKVSEEEAIK